jgi:hypothetical protein
MIYQKLNSCDTLIKISTISGERIRNADYYLSKLNLYSIYRKHRFNAIESYVLSFIFIIMSPTNLIKEYFPELSQEVESQMLQFMEDLSV